MKISKIIIPTSYRFIKSFFFKKFTNFKRTICFLYHNYFVFIIYTYLLVLPVQDPFL